MRAFDGPFRLVRVRVRVRVRIRDRVRVRWSAPPPHDRSSA